jgi:hypothetical protein
LYALKKIRCTLGTEEADLAQKEVDIYQLFSHKNIIKMLVKTKYSFLAFSIIIQWSFNSLLLLGF